MNSLLLRGPCGTSENFLEECWTKICILQLGIGYCWQLLLSLFIKNIRLLACCWLHTHSVSFIGKGLERSSKKTWTKVKNLDKNAHSTPFQVWLIYNWSLWIQSRTIWILLSINSKFNEQVRAAMRSHFGFLSGVILISLLCLMW